MVSELDPISWILPLIISTAVPFSIIALHKYSKNSNTTLEDSINLRNVEGKLEALRILVDKAFERAENLADRTDEKVTEDFRAIYQKLEEISTKVSVNTYRLDSLERRAKNGGGKSAV